jgi:hypothetical protein
MKSSTTELRSGSNKNAHGIRKAISQRSGNRAPLHESDCGTRRGLGEALAVRIGVWRNQGKVIIDQWPAIDDADESGNDFLAINNCLNEVCHEFRIEPNDQ